MSNSSSVVYLFIEKTRQQLEQIIDSLGDFVPGFIFSNHCWKEALIKRMVFSVEERANFQNQSPLYYMIQVYVMAFQENYSVKDTWQPTSKIQEKRKITLTCETEPDPRHCQVSQHSLLIQDISDLHHFPTI